MRLKARIRFGLQHPLLLWMVYGLAAVLISLQRLSLSRMPGEPTAYENYRIFRNAFTHLLQHLNPYAAYPAEQWDLFKYSPAFALGMGPFAAMPDWLGLPLWNLLNSWTLLAAIFALPVLDARQRRFMAWFVLPELVVSLQNSQSNGLTAALLLFAFAAMERGKSWSAAAQVALSAFIKIFGIFAAALAWLYPQKGRFVAWLTGWSVFLFLIPLLVLPWSQLEQVYRWWLELLLNDHDASVGLSVQGWLQSWFGLQPDKLGVTLAGLVVWLLSVLAAGRRPEVKNRVLVWASLLLWVVIFNHKAESPTFVVALSGAALWYAVSERSLGAKIFLFVLFFAASITPTDLFPRAWLNEWVKPYVLKAVPCIALWSWISVLLLRNFFRAPDSTR